MEVKIMSVFNPVTITELETSPVRVLIPRLIETLSNDVTNEFLSVFVRVVEMELEENFAEIFSIDYFTGTSLYDNICKLADSDNLSFLTPDNEKIIKSVYEVEDCNDLKSINADVLDALNLITNSCGEQAYYSFIGNILNNKRCKGILVDELSRGFLD
jgi:hypothetical protein